MYSRQKDYATFQNPDEVRSSGDEGRCWLPIRCETSLPGELPQRRAGLLSQMTYSWLTPLMRLAYRKGLTADDLYDMPPEHEAERNADRFEAIWDREVQCRGEQNASVTRVLIKLAGLKLVLSSFLIVISSTCSIISPAFFMSELLHYADTPKDDLLLGPLLVFGMTAMEVLRSWILAFAWSLNCEAGVRASSSVMSAMYRKVLRVHNHRELSPGEVINLFSNDGMRIFEALHCGNLVIAPIVSGVIGAAISIRIVGVWGLLGFFAFYCMLPLQAVLSKTGAKMRFKSLSFTDLRVKLTTEAIMSIRLIKQYSWEAAFSKNIIAARNRERSHLEKVLLINGILATVPTVMPSLAALAAFTGILLSTGSLTLLQAFTLVATLNGLRGSTLVLPIGVKAITDALLAAGRIKKILIMKERPTGCMEMNANIELRDSQVVVFSKASFSWPTRQAPGDRKSKGEASDKNKDASGACSLSDITLKIDKGKLYAVCGEVGSGKSSFLAAIAGLIPRTAGAMVRRGSIAYVAQQAWIMNATLRDNILFGLPMDERRYRNVLDCCGLVVDLAILPMGDMTELGDKGVNLSGGQKQRVSLARAVYSDRDIYLLDDPLSAVDASVGKHIHEKCVNGVLKGKTVVFVTHQLQFLHGCDVLFVKGGRITEGFQQDILVPTSSDKTAHHPNGRAPGCGDLNYNPALNRKEDSLFENIIYSNVLKSPVTSSSVEERKNGDPVSHQVGAVPQLKQEFLDKGKISWVAFKGYLKSAGFVSVSLSLLLVMAMTFFTNISIWWLSFWLQHENAGIIISEALHLQPLLTVVSSDRLILIIQAACLGAAALFLFLKSVSFTKMSMRASNNFHNAILDKALHSPLQFFDWTPTGQIINRFSKDIDEMDTMFPLSMESFIQGALGILASMVLVSIGMPYMTAVIVPMFIIVIVLYRILSPGARELKRLEHSARSRWFSHIATTLNGISTIRAYGKEQPFTDRFYELTDTYSMTLGLYNNSARWLAVRFDAIYITVVAVTGCLIAFLPTYLVIPEAAALSISSALMMSINLQNTIRLAVDSQCRFLSAERLWSYMNELTSEEDQNTKGKVSDYWPHKGEIIFEDVSLRYRPDLPTVLKEISFTIQRGEKIGIVGRTGSGKSSLGVTLLRLAEIDKGKVIIDGVDISHVSVQVLRSKISIIPQDPVLFLGSLRYNLDPLGLYSDADLQISLRKCNLAISERFSDGLDTHIVEGGENLSVGERYLICMARALLRRSKILIMDEATAAMDVATDKRVMNTVKEAFSECTVLIVAHRLNTVLQCHRIMVLENGKIVEFEAPEKLLRQEDSLLCRMVKSMSPASDS